MSISYGIGPLTKITYPPGWLETNSETSYTYPLMAIQQSSSLECLRSSLWLIISDILNCTTGELSGVSAEYLGGKQPSVKGGSGSCGPGSTMDGRERG